MRKQRRFTMTKDNIEIMVDFGDESKPNELTCEVTSRLLPNNKKEVLSARSLGRAKRWFSERINEYLSEFYECVDE